jgi:hypothetical protein
MMKTQSIFDAETQYRQKQIDNDKPGCRTQPLENSIYAGFTLLEYHSFDLKPTGKRSIFTHPSRVKNALAFLHGVFTNLFGARWF